MIDAHQISGVPIASTSCRVERGTAPRYYHLIERFSQATGVPLLLNTSFNLKGEPIVNTPQEAFRTFEASEMDALVLDHYLVEKSR